MHVTISKKIFNLLSNTAFVLIIITLLNLLLRIIFINYAYISTDEGIALYNTRLAYQGLRPFIDYNGWNSLINDYLFGLSRIFLFPTIITQRYFALLISLFSFAITLRISYLLSGKRSLIWTALFFSFGSFTYTYLSNFPYSTEMMTLGILFTLLGFLITEKTTTRHKFWLEIPTYIVANITVLIRSQMLPLPVIIWFMFSLRKKTLKEKFDLTIRMLAISLLIFTPFLVTSWKHTLYGLFWPFFAASILVYVAHVSKNAAGQLAEFLRVSSQQYGVLISLVLSSLFIRDLKGAAKNIPRGLFVILILCLLFLATALIHRPADPYYLYPSIPLLAIAAAFFLTRLLNTPRLNGHAKFIKTLVILLLGLQFLHYPHFKVMKTQLSDLHTRPYDLLIDINNFILAATQVNDEILTFYLPAVANINRQVPLNMNEGQGSLTIRDDLFAAKFHLTTIPQLQKMISKKQTKLIVFTDTFIYYFGQNENERQETLKLIKENYSLVKEFPEFKLVDGSNAQSLMIYKANE